MRVDLVGAQRPELGDESLHEGRAIDARDISFQIGGIANATPMSTD
jgi:hypothetical protein